MLNSVVPIMYNWPMSNKFRFSEAVLILFLSFKICFFKYLFCKYTENSQDIKYKRVICAQRFRSSTDSSFILLTEVSI